MVNVTVLRLRSNVVHIWNVKRLKEVQNSLKIWVIQDYLLYLTDKRAFQDMPARNIATTNRSAITAECENARLQTLESIGFSNLEGYWETRVEVSLPCGDTRSGLALQTEI